MHGYYLGARARCAKPLIIDGRASPLKAGCPGLDQRFLVFFFVRIGHVDVVGHGQRLAVATEADNIFTDFDLALAAEPVLQMGGFLDNDSAPADGDGNRVTRALGVADRGGVQRGFAKSRRPAIADAWSFRIGDLWLSGRVM